MSFAQRFAPLLLVLAAAGLSGCAMTPFRVAGSEAAVEAAKADSAGMLPRLQPRALGVCYSRAFNEPAEVEAEAVYLCEGGRLVKQDEDFFWNGCSLTQPHRINYVCYPPDKAKRLNGAS
ncbi:MAG TPA: hypothetical protein VIS03_04980 [Kiloniellaceae bacterium]